MRIFLNYRFSILFLLSIFIFISCSKDDSDAPDSSEISVTTSDFSITIDENPSNGQVIGNVQGTANKGTIAFSIVEQFPEGAFSIDSATGELKVANETLFNFEVNPTITGMVKVAQGTLFKVSNITIALNNMVEDKVYQGDVHLKNQNEVIQFGIEGYTQITGNLRISPSFGEYIVDLTPLLNIEKIEGALIISNCINLITTDGLRNVSKIGDGLYIGENPELREISDLQNLTILGGDLYILDNYFLTNISGLSQLSEINGGMSIFDTSVLNFDALSNLKTIDGNLTIYGNLELLNIDGLSNLKTVGDDIYIRGNFYITNLNGLSNVTATISVLEVAQNTFLENIGGLHNIEATERLVIESNTNLKNLNGLSAIKNVNRISIVSNNSLLNLQGLNNLNTVGDNGLYNGLYIERNINLKDLSGLEGISDISGGLSIQYNYLLRNFCSLKNYLTNNNPNTYNVIDNFYNPTMQDIVNGNCSI